MRYSNQPSSGRRYSRRVLPVLRLDGFQGSGRKFARLSGPWIEIITIQGSRWGGSFAVNLGIHFAAAPDVTGATPDTKKMTEAHCEFRRRLSDTRTDMWWQHEASEASMLAAIQSAAEMYRRFGRTLTSTARKWHFRPSRPKHLLLAVSISKDLAQRKSGLA